MRASDRSVIALGLLLLVWSVLGLVAVGYGAQGKVAARARVVVTTAARGAGDARAQFLAEMVDGARAQTRVETVDGVDARLRWTPATTDGADVLEISWISN